MVVVEAAEVFSSNVKGEGEASSYSKYKRKTVESLIEMATKKKLLASAM